MKVMSRWPAMMGVVTVVPALNLSDPRDTNVVVAVGEPSKRYLSANQASTAAGCIGLHRAGERAGAALPHIAVAADEELVAHVVPTLGGTGVEAEDAADDIAGVGVVAGTGGVVHEEEPHVGLDGNLPTGRTVLRPAVPRHDVESGSDGDLRQLGRHGRPGQGRLGDEEPCGTPNRSSEKRPATEPLDGVT